MSVSIYLTPAEKADQLTYKHEQCSNVLCLSLSCVEYCHSFMCNKFSFYINFFVGLHSILYTSHISCML